MAKSDRAGWQCREQQVEEVGAMNVVSLTCLLGRCRPGRGRDHLAFRTAQRDAIDWRSDLAQLIVEADTPQ
jgi:hypothetical protein